jgi:hypothetical protein
MKIAIEPISGAKVQDVITRLYATPKALVARLAEASKQQPDLKILNKPTSSKSKK